MGILPGSSTEMEDAPLLLPSPRSSVEAVINANNKRARDDQNEVKPLVKSEENDAGSSAAAVQEQHESV